MNDKFIDVEKIILDKNPKLYNRLPKFVLSYLKKILWEDEVNRIIVDNKGVSGVQFCRNVIREFNIKVTIDGIENAPKSGGVTFASNHPLGGIDALAFIDQFSHYRSDIKFIANDILLNLEPMRDIFVGVNIGTGIGVIFYDNVSDQVVPLAFGGVHAGARWYFADKIGLTGQFGFGKSLIDLGLVFKLN